MSPSESPSRFVLSAKHVLRMSGYKEAMPFAYAKENALLGQRDEQILGYLPDSCVLVEDGRVTFVGAHQDLPPHAQTLPTYSGHTLMPSWVECHTHAIFAGSRADEFVLKNAGLTYAQIAQAGGGIRRSVRDTRLASDEELLELLVARLLNFVRQGVGVVEVKSGYGLSTAQELRLLRIIAKAPQILAQRCACAIELHPTFLGAHSLPPEFLTTAEYTQHIVEEMLPQVAAQGIARVCDVFCEQGAFSLPQAIQIWERAKSLGMQIRAHAEQFTNSGASVACARLGALSADHLDELTHSDIEELKASSLVPVVFPLVCIYMDTPKRPPVRELIDAGLPLAISTNLNPGTCPSADLGLAAATACTLFHCTPAEALYGITHAAALALGLQDTGQIRPGAKARLLLLDDDYASIVYNFGKKHIQHHIFDGIFIK